MQSMKKSEGESYLAFAKRATEALQDGLIDYQEWGEAVLGENIYSEENTRRCAKFFIQFVQNLENDEIEQIDDKDRVAEIKKAMEELKTERLKIQTANLEYNANTRAEARNDLFNEEMIRAIGRLEPLKISRHENTYQVDADSTLLITLSDFHAGSTFVVKGLYGEIVNQYDYNIMWHRLYNLIDQIETDCINFKDCKVAILGDCFENVLRTSSLLKLREPVIDTVIKFSEDMCQWIVRLADVLKTDVEVITVGGNHDCQRLLESRPNFEDENLTKFVVAYMVQRLIDINRITVDPYQEIAIKNIRGTNVMFCHGEDKDLTTTMDYFSNLYNIDIDEGYGGHLHRPESKTIGITEVGDRMFTRVGSIVGIDTFAKKIRVSARPSAYVAIYTDTGKTWSRNYYL